VMQQRRSVCTMVVRRGFVVVEMMLQGELGHQVKQVGRVPPKMNLSAKLRLD
jgi:hypothetical protein